MPVVFVVQVPVVHRPKLINPAVSRLHDRAHAVRGEPVHAPVGVADLDLVGELRAADLPPGLVRLAPTDCCGIGGSAAERTAPSQIYR